MLRHYETIETTKMGEKPVHQVIVDPFPILSSNSEMLEYQGVGTPYMENGEYRDPQKLVKGGMSEIRSMRKTKTYVM